MATPPPPSIYRNPAAKAALMDLYNAKQASLAIPDLQERDIETPQGRTHVLIAGPESAPPVLLLHGIHAGAPLAMEAMAPLTKRFRVYAVDTIGQATKSAENRPPLNDSSLGQWLAATMDGLGLQNAAVIGVSYGGFLLLRLIAHAPERVSKAIFVVPGGLVNGKAGPSMRKLFWPLMRFQMTKKDKHLRRFMEAFYKDLDDHHLQFQRLILTGVKMDYRKPPLAQAAEVAVLKSPVYAMVAEDDIFFPGPQAAARCKEIFPNFKESHVLQGAKHIPSLSDYPHIAQKLGQWLDA